MAYYPDRYAYLRDMAEVIGNAEERVAYELLEESDRKDKTIRKMAEYIANQDMAMEICKNVEICKAKESKNNRLECSTDLCVECVIKHFIEVE